MKEVMKSEWIGMQHTLIVQIITEYFAKKMKPLPVDVFLKIVDFVKSIIIGSYYTYCEQTGDKENAPISEKEATDLYNTLIENKEYFDFLKDIIELEPDINQPQS
jgi:hypothetical protein